MYTALCVHHAQGDKDKGGQKYGERKKFEFIFWLIGQG